MLSVKHPFRTPSSSSVCKCALGQNSAIECGPPSSSEIALQTLSELEAANSLPGANKTVRISWIILSRLGVNYLVNPSTYLHLTICANHRKEYLDSWRVGWFCRYPAHPQLSRQNDTHGLTAEDSELITFMMAVKILQKTQEVVPISGRICKVCKSHYEEAYPTKAGQKMVIVLSSNNYGRPAITAPSPFGPPEVDEPPVQSEEDPLALFVEDGFPLKTEVPDPDDPDCPIMQNELNDEEFEDLVEIKDEVIDPKDIVEPPIVPLERAGTPPTIVRDDQILLEEDGESLFSEDSDDDRTWMPEVTKSPVTKKDRPVRSKKRKASQPAETTPEGSVSKPGSSPAQPGKKGEQHYFCKICKISFFKHTSYKQHMHSSQKAHKEALNKAKDDEEEEFECSDCCIAFQNREARAKHMSVEHAGGKDLNYCLICEVQLKNESAFKSHNSKMHLERSKRMYYCRECDATFLCKVLHQTHIKTHRLWSGETPGLQCQVCGKVFMSKQLVQFQRHQETHDADTGEDCPCSDCRAKSSSSPLSKKKKPNEKAGLKDNLLVKMQSKFITQVEETDPDDEEIVPQDGDLEVLKGKLPFQCGLCHSRYDSVKELDKHVQISHSNKAKSSESKAINKSAKVIKVIGSTQEENDAKSVGKKTKVTKPSERNWQECADRNWAAEFGYGKSRLLAPSDSDGLLSAMKTKFKHENGDEAEGKDEIPDVGDGFQIYRSRTLNGRSKASPQKTPRTLSASSLSTRKRIEVLMKKAQKMHEEREKKRRKKTGNQIEPKKNSPGNTDKKSKASASPKKSPKSKNTKSKTNSARTKKPRNQKPSAKKKQVKESRPKKRKTPVVNESDTSAKSSEEGEALEEILEEDLQEEDDDDFVGFEDEDESLLIPMVNGWVCEKQPGDNGYLTSFWSPDGGHFTSLALIAEHLKKINSELSLSVFEKAVQRVPKHTSNQLTDIMDEIVDEFQDEFQDDISDSEMDDEITLKVPVQKRS